jgi:hypothetical protein
MGEWRRAKEAIIQMRWLAYILTNWPFIDQLAILLINWPIF